MDVTTIPDPAGYAELSIEEKADYIQLLWDRLFDEARETEIDELPVPESHLKLAEERLESYLRDPSRARSAYDIINELSNRSK